MSSMGGMKKKPEDIFPSIRQVKEDGQSRFPVNDKEASTVSLKQSVFGDILLKAGIS